VAQPKPTEFDAYRDDYGGAVQDSIAFSGAEHEFFTRAKARILLELAERRVGPADSLAFLDVGCGPGETDRFLASGVGSLIGVDISTELLGRAGEANPWADYRPYAAGGPLPTETASVDVSFAICVFHHVEAAGQPDLLAEMSRATKPGGIVAIFEHNPWNPLTRRAVAGCEFDRDAVLLSRRRAAELLREAELSHIQGSYIVFFTRSSPPLEALERRLRWLPLGAQYVVSGVRN
jgi:SAM-dependent methyltransferase